MTTDGADMGFEIAEQSASESADILFAAETLGKLNHDLESFANPATPSFLVMPRWS